MSREEIAGDIGLPRDLQPTEPRIHLYESEIPEIRSLCATLTEDFLDEYKLTSSQIARLCTALKKDSKRGARSGNSLVCRGPNCVLANTCPLDKSGCAPVGLNCPIEEMIKEQMRGELTTSLAIDAENIVERIRLNDLITTMIIERRAEAMLSKEDLIDEAPAFATPRGTIVTTKKINPLFDVLEKCEKKKASIIKEFVATRESKAKNEKKDENSKSLKESRLRTLVDQIKNAEMESSATEAEFKKVE